MKNKNIRIYVYDWNPNGTNDVLVMQGDRVLEAREEVLFGVNVNKLKASYPLGYSGEYPIYRIPKRLVKRHVASNPIEGTHKANCTWLKRYMGGAK